MLLENDDKLPPHIKGRSSQLPAPKVEKVEIEPDIADDDYEPNGLDHHDQHSDEDDEEEEADSDDDIACSNTDSDDSEAEFRPPSQQKV